MRKLIIEKRIDEISQWFSIKDSNIEEVIKILENCNQDKDLIEKLREFSTTINKELIESKKNINSDNKSKKTNAKLNSER